MNGQHQPSVSVVMTSYNGARFIGAQLDSILAQTYPVMEVIVQDDGSTDDTTRIVRDYMVRDARVKLYVNEHNLGWNRNFISAMHRASGDYIALSDQDDIWFPDKIHKEMAAIGEHALCFCFRYKDPTFTLHGRILGHPQPDFESLLFTSHIPGHDMLFRRTLLGDIDTWNDYIPYDWWLAIQAHLHGGLTRVPEALNWHRPHADSASAVMMKDAWKKAEHVTWQPYLFGWSAYRRFQQMEDWQWFYRYIAAHTTGGAHSLVHRMSCLMCDKHLSALLQLCLLTMRHRRRVHERFAGGHGLRWVMNAVRGFFYPLMWAYNSNASFIRKPATKQKNVE